MSGVPVSKVIVIAGFNGLATAHTWLRHFTHNNINCPGVAFSWRDADSAVEAIAAEDGWPVTLIGHSLGGGQAQLIAQRFTAGAISRLITVAPYAPPMLDTRLVRKNVASWLNIVAAHRWHDPILDKAASLLLGWRDQGVIVSAAENHRSDFPHRDFYRMMSEVPVGHRLLPDNLVRNYP